MKNLPQTEWIETETKEKNKQEKTGQEKDLKCKRWNKIFDDDVSIVYCNAPNVKRNRSIRLELMKWRRKKQERLLFNKRKSRNQIVETNRATHLTSLPLASSLLTDVWLADKYRRIKWANVYGLTRRSLVQRCPNLRLTI